MIEEQKLAAQIHAGDYRAEERFRKLFRPRLVRASLYLLDDDELEASAAVNETFAFAIPKLKNFDFSTPLSTFLGRICSSRCYARLQSRGRLLDKHENDTELFLSGVLAEHLKGEDSWRKTVTGLKIIDELKGKLSGESRRILDMRDYQGFSFAQIGHSLGIPQAAAMTRLFNAREKLRHLIQNLPPESLARISGLHPSLSLSLGMLSLDSPS